MKYHLYLLTSLLILIARGEYWQLTDQELNLLQKKRLAIL